MEYTPKKTKYLGGAKKLLTAIITTTLLLSFSPVSVFASCSPEEQYQIETEIRMMESIITAPSPAQRRENYLERINAIAQLHTTNEKDVQGLIFKHYPETLPFETIRHIDFEIEITDSSNVTNGRGELHTATLYEDGATGYSVDGFDFAITNNEVIHFELDPMIPEAATQAAIEEAKDFVPTEPTVEKEAVQEPKPPAPLPPQEEQLTPQEIHEGAKVSAKETKEELEARKDSNCKLTVSASSGEYDRKKAVEYAHRHWSREDGMYNPNYPDYHIDMSLPEHEREGGDCTNFASQIVQAGGLRQDTGHGLFFWDRDDKSNTQNWYVRKNGRGGFDHSKSWTSVIHFLDHMKYHENTEELLDFQERGYDIFNEMQIGDVMFMDLGNGGKEHVMTITGWVYKDGKRIPLLTYHTSDHKDRPLDEIIEKYKEESDRYWGLPIKSEIR